MNPRLGRFAAGVSAPVAAAAVVLAYAFVWNYMLPIHAGLKARDLKDVRVTEPVSIQFDKAIDEQLVRVVLTPATEVNLKWSADRLTVTPKTGWQPAQRYSLALHGVANSVHTRTLDGWTARFQTQPMVGVQRIEQDGREVKNGSSVRLHSPVQIVFSTAMEASTVKVLLNGRAPAAASWSKDGTVLSTQAAGLQPFARLALSVAPQGRSRAGDPVTSGWNTNFNVLGLVPSNSTSGITGDFKTKEPILVVIENSPQAKPQSGLQEADIVYEYVSEYSITRMTAIYFNQPPNTNIGPVRSCRLIQLYLPWAYSGVNLCSGASTGTEHILFEKPFVPALQQPFAPRYFFRVGFNVIPHNLYTNGPLAAQARNQWPLPKAPYQVDPPHADNNLGTPSLPPTVDLHHVSYTYDGGSKQYLRFDRGAPFVDASTGQQLHVKNVVLLHVPFRVMGYVEDESGGGALSVWYYMLGSGPAEIYSDGKVIHATWHMGKANQRWSDNHQPVYFTDSGGNIIELNTGLTWIHVLGNGQTS